MESGELLLKIDPTSHFILQELAESAGVDSVETLLNESMDMGLACAEIFLENQTLNQITYVYELKDDLIVVRTISLDFEGEEMPPLPTVALPEGMKDPFADGQAYLSSLDPEMREDIIRVTEALGMSIPDFVNYSVSLRRLLHQINSNGNAFLISCGPDEAIEIGKVDGPEETD